MYSESYMTQMEKTGLTAIIEVANTNERLASGLKGLPIGAGRTTRVFELAEDHTVPSPPEALEREEEGTVFDSILRQAMSDDERVVLRLIEELLDNAWQFGTGKALRAELRCLFTSDGRSERRFYTAFHGIERRVVGCR